ncbi:MULTISPECIES: MFS transporter [unclassified Microbacterium]|uniref:MFS transporter n=1 Tax=unclassified Microbacterium TaxID=2609290 RepID=UPI001784B048|nr:MULTISPECIES: MFS transporter [unclassified Microbacterium]MBD8206994.1 MFS transporter [Microbacterium sp. CFBP 8801]MBD8479550.1 MFS transporter [Microbacterium sp. CFBP 8794]MBD8508852.1 MFS transporter [Microbacterium sp. CFBP 8790]
MSVAAETGQGVRAYGQVLRLPGARTFVAAGILARFPRATLSLGIILLVSAATGSFASAGLVVAPLVVGMAIAAPLWSSRMDRHGQSRVILVSLGCLVLAASAFLALVLTGSPFWTWLIAAFVTGAATPDLTSAVRARWTVLAPPSQRTAALALETIADQMVFIAGPPAITAVAAALDPAVAVLGSLGLGLIGGVWLASQRGTQPASTPRTERRGVVLPPAGVIPIALACVALGGVFGAFDVGLVGWAEVGGHPWLAGPAFSALAVAIAIGSVVTGARTWRLSPAARYIGFAALAALVAVGLPFAQGSVPVLFGVILLLGLAVSPVMVSGILVASARAPEGRVTETLAYPTAAMSLGVPIGGVIAGAALDATGPAVALVTIAVSLALAAGIAAVGEAVLRVGRSDPTP